jgi:hypothetical protein
VREGAAKMAKQMEKPTQAEMEVFFRRLDEFRETLPKNQQARLATIVVRALGQEPPLDEGSAGEETELDAHEGEEFRERMQAFHDELPEREHELLHAMLADVFPENEADVQAHHRTSWWNASWYEWVPNSQVQWWWNHCRSEGGRASIVAQNASYSKIYCFRYL